LFSFLKIELFLQGYYFEIKRFLAIGRSLWGTNCWEWSVNKNNDSLEETISDPFAGFGNMLVYSMRRSQ
jgi:hypothetical protein